MANGKLIAFSILFALGLIALAIKDMFYAELAAYVALWALVFALWEILDVLQKILKELRSRK
jgi:hypothetical protein